MWGRLKRDFWRRANPVKLIVHIGLHKTGSTYLQHILNDNVENLRGAGLFYDKQHGYPAHHRLAWNLLLGDEDELVQLIDWARFEGCKTLLVSSEDLEGMLFDERPLQAIRNAVRRGRVSKVEIHVVLRNPGDAFASLFKELAKHTYADLLSLYHSVMSHGFVHMVEPGSGVPYWYYSFDHARDLATLAARSGWEVIAHDFRDAHPFPGWRIVENELSLLEHYPSEEGRNASNSDEVTTDLYERHLREIGVSHKVEMSDLPDYSRAISSRFAASYARALEEFGQAARDVT